MTRQTKDIGLFLFLAFFLPFLCVYAQSIVDNMTINFILYGIQAASPTIATIFILRKNREGKAFLMDMFHKDTCLISVGLPALIACATMFIAKLLYGVLFQIEFTLGDISFSQLLIISWAFIAEEWGWRGYLEPALQRNGKKKWQAPCIVGVIWCLWHYHFFIMNAMQIPILVFFISCIMESYIYSWLMDATKNNLISAMTYHFLWNLCIHIFAINPIDNQGDVLPYIILVALEFFVILFFYANQKNKES